MSALIPIPQALATEVAAGPDRFKPPVEVGQQVLILARSNEHGQSGWSGPVLKKFEGDAGQGIMVETRRVDDARVVLAQSAAAWALVGSATSGGWPEFGARVLVLRAAHVSAAVGMIGTVQGGGLGGQILVDFGADIPDDDGELDRNWVVSEWAILPPADQPLVPEMPDMPSSTVNVQGDRRASVHELSEILVSEFGGHRPGETSIRAAIRVMRELRDQLAAARAEASRRGSIGPAERGDTDG